MARVVETVAHEMGDALQVEIIYTKQLDGALRYTDISRAIGRPAPVPSIIINGVLAFDQTPSVEDLKAHLSQLE